MQVIIAKFDDGRILYEYPTNDKHKAEIVAGLVACHEDIQITIKTITAADIRQGRM